MYIYIYVYIYMCVLHPAGHKMCDFGLKGTWAV